MVDAPDPGNTEQLGLGAAVSFPNEFRATSELFENCDRADAFRAVLLQDPDVLIVGELADAETARLCVRPALTGHLVVTSMHINNAISGIGRLRDMGIEPSLIAEALVGVSAQRLVRIVCKNCAVEYSPPKDLLKKLGVREAETSSATFRRGKGCEACKQTGYGGRAGIYELLEATPEIQAMICQGASAEALRAHAFPGDAGTLQDDARRKVLEGLTTAEEAVQVLWGYR